MKVYKKVVAVFLVLTMSAALCACGKSSAEEINTQPEATTAAEATTAPEATAVVTEGMTGAFSLFHFHEEGGAGTSAAFWSAADKFTTANAGVTIDYQFTDSDNYEEKLTTLMAGDELPDVFLTKGDMLSTLADAGLIQA
ncbi:MAG: extracellular solute-binding protein, partial [Mobilitalea sp.]